MQLKWISVKLTRSHDDLIAENVDFLDFAGHNINIWLAHTSVTRHNHKILPRYGSQSPEMINDNKKKENLPSHESIWIPILIMLYFRH